MLNWYAVSIVISKKFQSLTYGAFFFILVKDGIFFVHLQPENCFANIYKNRPKLMQGFILLPWKLSDFTEPLQSKRKALLDCSSNGFPLNKLLVSDCNTMASMIQTKIKIRNTGLNFIANLGKISDVLIARTSITLSSVCSTHGDLRNVLNMWQKNCKKGFIILRSSWRTYEFLFERTSIVNGFYSIFFISLVVRSETILLQPLFSHCVFPLCVCSTILVS